MFPRMLGVTGSVLLLLLLLISPIEGEGTAAEEGGGKVNKTIYNFAALKIFLNESATGPPAQSFCSFYPSDYYPLPATTPTNQTIRFKLIADNTTRITPSDQVLLLLRAQLSKNQTVQELLNYVKERGASGSILISTSYLQFPPKNESELPNLEAVVLMGSEEGEELEHLATSGGGVQPLYVELEKISIPDDYFEGSTAILGLMAVFCIVVGSLTAPYVDVPSGRSMSTHQQIVDAEGNEGGDVVNRGDQNPLQLFFTVKVVFLIVTFITSVLLLLYFFFDYLVYFFMAVFCIASGRALFELLMQILNLCHSDDKVVKLWGYGIHRWGLGIVCAVIPILWFIFRKTPYIWILEDVLGVCFCIHLIQTMKIPNLKICTILLSLLFFYDIFFVFITPFFTSNGKSIMVEVATGGGSGETLPLLLQVPHLRAGITCFKRGFSLLGFGDIILPGFLISFAHAYDLLRGDKRPIYFLTGILGYIVGISIAFVVLHLTKTGQPALLYIVPATVIPLLIVSALRGQCKEIWAGVVSND